MGLILWMTAAMAVGQARSLNHPQVEDFADLEVFSCPIPCAVQVACPRELVFKTGNKSVGYAGKELVEEIFQRALQRRFLPHAGSNANACIAEIEVYSILVSGSRSRLVCRANLRCKLRDFQGTILFNKVYDESATSRFDGSTVPSCIVSAISQVAASFVKDSSGDPRVVDSHCGCHRVQAVVIDASSFDGGDSDSVLSIMSSGEKLRLAVMSLSDDERLRQVNDIFVTEFTGLKSYEVIPKVDIDKVIAESRFAYSDMADPDKVTELGKLLSAQVLLTGSCGFLAGDVSMNVRIVDVETGKTLVAVSQVVRYDSISISNTVKLLTREIHAKLHVNIQ